MIDADNLLMPGDNTCFDGCEVIVRALYALGVQPALVENLNELLSLAVTAGQAHHCDGFGEGLEITGNIGRAARIEFLPLDLHNWDWGFRRYAADIPPQEAVKHDIADDQDSLVSEVLESITEARFVHGIWIYWQ